MAGFRRDGHIYCLILKLLEMDFAMLALKFKLAVITKHGS